MATDPYPLWRVKAPATLCYKRQQLEVFSLQKYSSSEKKGSFSLKEVAQELGMSRSWVYQRIKSGEVPHVKLGQSLIPAIGWSGQRSDGVKRKTEVISERNK